jgi:hypothetical protein
MHEEDNPSFWDEFKKKLLLFLHSLIHIRIIKQNLSFRYSHDCKPGGLILYFWVHTYGWDFQITPIHVFNIFENQTHSYISVENPDDSYIS